MFTTIILSTVNHTCKLNKASITPFKTEVYTRSQWDGSESIEELSHTKPADLSLSSGAYTVEGEQLQQLALWPLHV